MDPRPFFRVPPFPGRRIETLAEPGEATFGKGEDVRVLAMLLRSARVGGDFWGAQPTLPKRRDVLLAPDSQAQAAEMLADVAEKGLIRRVVMIGSFAAGDNIPVVSKLCDPWHLVDQASEVYAGANNELALVAAICEKPVEVFGTGRFAMLAYTGLDDCLESELLCDWRWRDPFTGVRLEPSQAITMLASWRRLIDANREAAGVYGVAMWKRVTADAMLWDGSGPVRHMTAGSRATRALEPGAKVLAWKSRASPRLPDDLVARGIVVGELEDGMIRSAGLGANCVPPLSIIADFAGAHFDPAQASGLEDILQHGEISADAVTRAAALRMRLVQAGISKYGRDGGAVIARLPSAQQRVLVTGQVEDDRSMLTGGAGCTNLDLLRRARECEPGAWLIYKPHPDVEAGHRKGAIPDADVLRYANEIERHAPIAALIDSVDAVHVITSLAGFEALMRQKSVTVHGVPFYAGWGLTTDLGPVPPRRSRRRSLDELVAAALLLYPRYLDPVTRLPCPVEIMVERMAKGTASVTSPLVWLREAQGQLKLAYQRLTKRG